ncbi:MAG: D-glycero-beta-D-manno-heptose 1-phosphate adenylyltransferase, partial [Chlorobiaceae bacterium]|nr:D-glycero-beta-D-manno-heptose 1-phosphate adenylyltransferase [Chlorobiaceae bacterium]
FDEDTPETLVGMLLPDILVKGSDWKVSEIAGSDAVLRHGGKVLAIPLLEGRSTSGIIDKIVRIYCQSGVSGETR